MKLKRIVCCMPLTWPYVASEFFMSCLDMKEYSINKYQLVFIIGRLPYIDKNRDDLVEIAFSLNPDYILWLDADAVYSKELPEKLMKHIDTGKLVVSGIYARKDNGLPSIYEFRDDGVHICVTERNQGIIQIDATGLQGVMMHPSVFEILEEPYFLMRNEGKEYDEGEDIAFYRKRKFNNIALWCDTDLYVPHLDLREIHMHTNPKVLSKIEKL